MHLIIVIALGIFAGNWLSVRWAEWRLAKLQRQYAAPPKPAPVAGGAPSLINVFIVLVAIATLAVIAASISGAHP